MRKCESFLTSALQLAGLALEHDGAHPHRHITVHTNLESGGSVTSNLNVNFGAWAEVERDTVALDL